MRTTISSSLSPLPLPTKTEIPRPPCSKPASFILLLLDRQDAVTARTEIQHNNKLALVPVWA